MVNCIPGFLSSVQTGKPDNKKQSKQIQKKEQKLNTSCMCFGKLHYFFYLVFRGFEQLQFLMSSVKGSDLIWLSTQGCR